MTFFQSVFLGILQGLTEFIPVSSSGHLVIIPKIFGWQDAGLAFDTTLHLGTLAALFVYFYPYIKNLLKMFLEDLLKKGSRVSAYSSDSRLLFNIAVGTIPAGLAGLIFGDFFESSFRTVFCVSIFLFLGSVLMYFADKNLLSKKDPEKKDDLRNVSLLQVIKVGFFQCLALFPGFSRSAATISGGLLVGIKREDSAKLSFLLSIPIIAAAGISQLPKALESLGGGDIGLLVLAFFASFLSGYVAVSWLLKYLGTHNLKAFILYRMVLALILLFFI